MPQVAARMASRDRGACRYQRHRPEQTLLYRIVEEHYLAFAGHLAEQGRELPAYMLRIPTQDDRPFRSIVTARSDGT